MCVNHVSHKCVPTCLFFCFSCILHAYVIWQRKWKRMSKIEEEKKRQYKREKRKFYVFWIVTTIYCHSVIATIDIFEAGNFCFLQCLKLVCVYMRYETYAWYRWHKKMNRFLKNFFITYLKSEFFFLCVKIKLLQINIKKGKKGYTLLFEWHDGMSIKWFICTYKCFDNEETVLRLKCGN